MGPYHKLISLGSYFLKEKLFLFMFGTLENGKSSRTAKYNIYIIKQYKAKQLIRKATVNNKEKIFIMAQKTQSPEFSNSILVKFLGHSFLSFKLLIYLPEVKRPKCFRGITSFLENLLTGLLHEPVTELIYSTCRPPSSFYLIFVHKWILGYHNFKTTPLKEMKTLNLIIAKNEFDPYDVMVGQLAIDSLQIS